MKKSNPLKKEKQNKKAVKQPYVDDGHTVYSMDGVNSPLDGFRSKDDGAKLARAEKRAAIKAALQVYLPILLGVIACFVLVGALLYLWLR